jgi:hypothetical protein
MCCFREEVSAKFISLGEKKDKNVLDSGLAGFSDFFGKMKLRNIKLASLHLMHLPSKMQCSKVSIHLLSLTILGASYMIFIRCYQWTLKLSDRTTRKAATTMISLTFVTTKVKCATCTCGCRRNLTSPI